MTAATKPRYQALKDDIIERIAKGELKPGDRVPSENELVSSSQVSRMTANRALRELTDEGYVQRVAGRGTFVSDLRAHSSILEVRDIALEIEARGHEHAGRVVRLERRGAEGEVARALGIEEGTHVSHLLLVHLEKGQPVQLEDRYVLETFAPDCLEQDFKAVTPSAYLSSIAPLTEAEQVVRAAIPTPTVRDQLDMAEDEPTLVVLRRTWCDGRAVTFARLHHPASRYELTGHYTPPGTAPSAPANAALQETLKQ